MLRTPFALPALLLCAALLSARDPDAGRRFALVVGVNAYRNDAFTPLNYAENDARELKAVLGRAGFAVTLLTTEEGRKDAKAMPTAANVRRAVEELVSGRREGDTVLICLAGHGIQLHVDDPEGTQKSRTFPYFCPTDAETTMVNPGTGHAPRLVNLDWVLRQLGSSTAGKKLLLVDACRNPVRATTLSRGLDAKRVTVPNGVCALFSCGPGQVAYEMAGIGKKGQGHGIFFHFVLEGLRGKAKDDEGVVTWASLGGYVTRQVTREVPLRIRPTARQTPQLVANIVGEPPVLVGRAAAAPVRIAHRTKADGPPGEEDYQRGRDYREGRGVRFDRLKAAEHYRKAAEAGHLFAKARVAQDRWLAEVGEPGSVMRQASLELHRLARATVVELRALARRGDPQAMLCLADLVDRGVAVAADREESARLTLAAAQKDHGPALLRLGIDAEAGRGRKGDHAAALGWYLQAVEQDEPRAAVRIGLLYLDGRGVGKDEADAAAWFRRAADAGCYSGKLHLALAHLAGRGVERSEEEALRLIDRDDPAALVLVGHAYRQGRVVAKDQREAVAWFRRAAEADHPAAQYLVGEAYRRGDGVERNEKEAARWLRKAAEQSCPAAMYAYGQLHEKGLGVDRSLVHARRWYRRAAAHGSAAAAAAMGRLGQRAGPGT